MTTGRPAPSSLIGSTRGTELAARLSLASSTRGTGSSCSLSPDVPLRESAPLGCSSPSSRNPGQPGFRTSGAWKIDILCRTDRGRSLLRSHASRSIAMPDPPK